VSFARSRSLLKILILRKSFSAVPPYLRLKAPLCGWPSPSCPLSADPPARLTEKLSFHSALQLGRELRLCILQMCFQPRTHPLCAVGNRLLFSVIALRAKHRNLRFRCQAESRNHLSVNRFSKGLHKKEKIGKVNIAVPIDIVLGIS
jgi:hypothetical protein